VDQYEFVQASPGTMQQWIYDHLPRRTSAELPEGFLKTYRLKELKDIAHASQIQQGFFEPAMPQKGRCLARRHLHIDGYPATVVTLEGPQPDLNGFGMVGIQGSGIEVIEGDVIRIRLRPSQPSSFRVTALFVYIPDRALLYEVWCVAEPPDVDRMDHEMQSIIASFHVLHTTIPVGSRR